MSAPSYKGLTNWVKGVPSAVSGINAENVTFSIEDPKEYGFDRYNGRTGFAYNFDPSITCTQSGEINVATDDLAFGATFGSALTVANSLGSGFGITYGGFYPDKIDLSYGRAQWKTASIDLTSIPGLA